MHRAKTLYRLALAAMLACSSAAHAVVYEFDYGQLLTASSGYSAPNSFVGQPFAHLEAINNGTSSQWSGDKWTFTLTIQNNLFNSFGDNAYIGSMTFDYNPDLAVTGKTLTTTLISSNVGGVTSVTASNGTGASGLADIDFGTAFGKGASNRLQDKDYVTWSVSNLTRGSNLVTSYVHVQGITGGYSAKYVPLPEPVSAVPEPETYAMMLAGLALLGFSARRRRNS